MNISSTPFIRNDYWPDYNDINQLNQRINEVENELSLTNIRLSANIENVSNDLNSYANNQANTTIANNIIVNNINANYAVGKFVNFGNANFDNAYIENLTVNKPVFDITLNTPHIENVTSLGGNIYDANMFNVSITGGNVAFNSVSIDDLTAVNATISKVNILDGDVNLNKAIIDNINASNAVISNVNILDGNININKAVIGDVNASNATISNLFVNTQPEPIQSSAVLGYDSQGRVIPVEATFDVGFPENANYLFTDEHGTAFAGTAATEVSAVNNLITAQAVQNGFNDINANVQNGFNDINANVQNGFNDINANVQNGFNDINAIGNNRYNDLLNVLNASISGGIGLDLQLNYINAKSPVDYHNVEHVVFTTGQIGNIWCDTSDKAGTQYYDWNATTNTLTFSSLTGIIHFNSDASNMFSQCLNLNQSILIPNSVANTSYMFYICRNLNQSILIPNSVTDASRMFDTCSNLNQNILIPNSVTNTTGMFANCTNLNKNILISNSVTNALYMFSNCTSLNQNILISNSVTNAPYMFEGCDNLDQNILIPNSVTNTMGMFYRCTSLNQNILIPNSITKVARLFATCTNLNKNILIPNSVTNASGMFSNCTSLNQNILIPNSVTSLGAASVGGIFSDCTSLNQNIFIYSENISQMTRAFTNCTLLSDKYIHIRSSIPMDTSNTIYNSLVNNYTGIDWTGRVINDLEEPTQWPPV